jgi:hypothetical protein
VLERARCFRARESAAYDDEMLVHGMDSLRTRASWMARARRPVHQPTRSSRSPRSQQPDIVHRFVSSIH